MLKNKNNSDTNQKAWIVAVDMGYGHQRTAYPLRGIAFGSEVINANNYNGIDPKDRRFWHLSRASYEFISRFRRVPFLGEKFFAILDRFQKIMAYYPKRDLSHSSFNLRNTFGSIRRGWGRDLIEKLKKKNLPMVTTFFVTAFMAEHFGYPNDIYCVICDADIARVWAPLNPAKSKIRYFVPNTWTRDRLKLYGVKAENIILTGYPLPKENLGGTNLETAKKDLAYRILNLDPRGHYRKLYAPLIEKYLGPLPKLPNHPLTIMFSIGGAGAQKERVLDIINSLKEKIAAHELRFIISIGVRKELKKYFADRLKDLELDGWVHVLSGDDVKEYFEKFNVALRTTDILWTKPSELSFYAGLGLPIVMAPTLGSQEDFNKRWLLHIGAGVAEDNPKYANEWLFDLLDAGELAEVAMEGFVEIEKSGTYHIEKIIAEPLLLKGFTIADLPARNAQAGAAAGKSASKANKAKK